MASFVSRPVIGPLAPFAEGFIAQLANLSYSTQAVKSHRRLLVHLSQWLAERGLGVRELTPEVSAKFLQMRRDVGFVTKVSDRGLQPLVRYLRELGERCEPSVIGSPSEELIDLVKRAGAGETVIQVFPPAHVRTDDAVASDASLDYMSPRLTPREREVLQNLAEGRGTAQVARELAISPLTVQSHVKSILEKLGVHSKIEAVTLAFRRGMVEVPGSRVGGQRR